MKMKTGPKVVLLAILFVGLGYWAGRGFPQTLEAFLHPNRAPVAVQSDTDEAGAGREGGSITSRRVNELEDRVADLEKTVDELRGEMRRAPSTLPAPETPETISPSETPAPAPSASEPTAPPAGTSPFPGSL